MVLIGVFGICTLISGGLKSFGILYIELSKKYTVTNRALSSIQSLTGFFFLGLAPISNALSVRFSTKSVTFIGGVLASFGLCLSGFVESLEVLYVTYGVITGVGFGLSFSPSIVILAFYFKKRRALASRFALSGCSVGSMLLPILLRVWLDEYGLQGTFLLYSAVMAHLCVFTMLLRAYDSYPVKKAVQCEQTNHKNYRLDDVCDSPLTNNADANICSSNSQGRQTLNAFGLSLSLPVILQFASNPALHVTTSISNTTVNKSVTIKSLYYEDRQTTVQTSPDIGDCEEVISATRNSWRHRCYHALMTVDWGLFKESVFLSFFVSIFLAMIGYHSNFNILPLYAEEMGLTKDDGAFLLFMFGIADLVGRSSSGIVMDILSSKRVCVYTGCMFMFATGVICTPEFKSLASLCACCGIYGIFGGGFNSTLMVILTDKVGLQRLSSAFGFLVFGMSIAMLVNPVATGAIKDSTGTWINAFRFTGSMTLLGGIILFIDVLRNLKNKNDKNSAKS